MWVYYLKSTTGIGFKERDILGNFSEWQKTSRVWHKEFTKQVCCRWLAWLNRNHPAVPVEDAGMPLTMIPQRSIHTARCYYGNSPSLGAPFFWKKCPASQQSVCECVKIVLGRRWGCKTFLREPNDRNAGIRELRQLTLKALSHDLQCSTMC